MKKILLCFLLGISFLVANGQWSVNTSYGLNSYPGFVKTPERGNEYQIGMEKKISVEEKTFGRYLVPNLRLALVRTTDEPLLSATVGLGFRFYPFAMGEDCDCPDFARKKNSPSKRFNLTVGLGGLFEYFEPQANQLAGLGYAQAAFDFPIPSGLMITPFLGGEMSSKLRFDLESDDIKSPRNQLSFGLRIGIGNNAKRR
jgi:hypothetical protein